MRTRGQPKGREWVQQRPLQRDARQRDHSSSVHPLGGAPPQMASTRRMVTSAPSSLRELRDPTVDVPRRFPCSDGTGLSSSCFTDAVHLLIGIHGIPDWSAYNAPVVLRLARA